ncbi:MULTISPECIES: DUF6531 domain-containing protein [unclassified Microbulbifer]|uniref:DUF6531 domain-containing protein n=1 Tax=unclassified Microbulbifer TaxID=2619833 RepID=UPI0027E3B90C|nr:MULTISPECIES: DUF6531 domain-containing protein [unclassified Microbulbifer]
MTPESLVNHIPQLLKSLRAPDIDIEPGNPAAFCRWLNQNLPGDSATKNTGHPLGPAWPRPPEIETNSYSLARAPHRHRLAGLDGGPIQMSSEPGGNPNGQRLPALEHCQQVSSHVIACNGEVAFSRTDAVIPGPLPFHWQRFYRHSNTDDCGLGAGWRHSLSEQLHILEGKAELHTADGRIVPFPLPPIGHSSYNRFERLLLHRQSLHSYRITGFAPAQRIFRADGVSNALPLVEIRDDFGNSLTVDYQQGLPAKIVSSWGRVVEFRCREQRIEQLVNSHAPGDRQILSEYRYDEGEILIEAATGPERERYQYRDELLTAIDGGTAGSLQFHYDRQQRCHKLHSGRLVQTLSWRQAQRRCTLHTGDRHPVHWKFNGSGQLISERQGDRGKSFLYDLYGNLCQITAADGERSIYRRDELGHLVRRTRGDITDRYLYDQRGLLAAAQEHCDQVWQYRHNDQGLPQQITDPAKQQWQFHYSDRGQLLQLVDPEGGRVELGWDSQGQLLSIQRNGREWKFEYNHWQQLTALIVDNETRREWHYGPSGELRETCIGEHRYTLDYDERGRPCTIHAGARESLHWDYDESGNCRNLHFADGREWQMRYNDFGQLAGLRGDAVEIAWQYDPFGLVSSCTDSGDRQWQWFYDANGEVREFRDNDIRWYFHRSKTGEQQKIRNNNGQQCEFHYDRQQRLVQAANAFSSVRFQYDQRNLLVAEHHDSRESGSVSLRHKYDSRGWLKSSSSDSLDLAYTFAPGGGLYGIDANGEAALRSEDQDQGINRIQGETHSRHNYRNGQLAAVEAGEGRWEFASPPPLSLSAPEPERSHPEGIERDLRGNITVERRPGERQREYRYQYDGWGLLSSAECGDFKTYFRYDPFGRRLSKLSTHRKSTRQRRVGSCWYSLGIWSETHTLNGKSQPTTHYLHHPVEKNLLCRWRQEDMAHYLVDPEGAPLALFDHRGEQLWHADRKAGDNQEPITGRSDCGPWRGRGLLADSETGLYYSWRGYWHPQLKIWLNACAPALPPGNRRREVRRETEIAKPLLQPA